MSPAQLQLALALVDRESDRMLREYLAHLEAASKLFEERAQAVRLCDELRAELDASEKAVA